MGKRRSKSHRRGILLNCRARKSVVASRRPERIACSGAGRLAAPSWLDGPTWQQHTYMTFEMLHLDKDFFTTAAGTSVFQHILNATTWVLLTQGRTATFGSIFEFMLGGMNGTVLSGAAQFGKTLILRSLFGWVWNFCSSQELDMPAFDTVLKGLPPNPAT